MYQRHETGRIGEDISVQYLQQIGYKIVERNFECKQGEIDIIAIDKEEIVFVEVKTRNTDYFIQPFEAVDFKKQKAIIKVANAYIRSRNIDLEARFDVISIVQNEQGSQTIEHIIGAFEPCLF